MILNYLFVNHSTLDVILVVFCFIYCIHEEKEIRSKKENGHLHNCDVNPHEDSQFLVKQFIHTLHYKLVKQFIHTLHYKLVKQFIHTLHYKTDMNISFLIMT